MTAETTEERVAALEERVAELEDQNDRLISVVESLAEQAVTKDDVRAILSEEVEGEVGDGVENALRDVFGPAATTNPDGRMFQ